MSIKHEALAQNPETISSKIKQYIHAQEGEGNAFETGKRKAEEGDSKV